LTLLYDSLRFRQLCLRPGLTLAAENLFLRKQLAMYQERHVKLKRTTSATRLVLVWLSRWFDWRQALAVVQPQTFLRCLRPCIRIGTGCRHICASWRGQFLTAYIMNTNTQRKRHDGNHKRVPSHIPMAYRGVNTMQYTLILPETTEGGIQVTIPALPARRVEIERLRPRGPEVVALAIPTDTLASPGAATRAAARGYS
jgi:hypothetical protein